MKKDSKEPKDMKPEDVKKAEEAKEEAACEEEQEEVKSRTIKIQFPADDTDRLMDREEVRLRLGIMEKTAVGALLKSGLLPCLHIGNRRFVRKVAFNKFLEEHEGEDIRKLAKESGFYGTGEYRGNKRTRHEA